jgi:hypothetical protein
LCHFNRNSGNRIRESLDTPSKEDIGDRATFAIWDLDKQLSGEDNHHMIAFATWEAPESSSEEYSSRNATPSTWEVLGSSSEEGKLQRPSSAMLVSLQLW